MCQKIYNLHISINNYCKDLSFYPNVIQNTYCCSIFLSCQLLLHHQTLKFLTVVRTKDIVYCDYIPKIPLACKYSHHNEYIPHNRSHIKIFEGVQSRRKKQLQYANIQPVLHFSQAVPWTNWFISSLVETPS